MNTWKEEAIISYLGSSKANVTSLDFNLLFKISILFVI